ncbi:MAG: TIGR02594 family protein [Rhizobiales bacterium]|nr:TIGR02594 family protein [Hyphomicrobiales bacterium]
MSPPPWLSEAFREHGTREVPGSGHNERIVRYAREAGQNWVRSDETPWCAAFVGAALERVGLRGSRSLLARSYLDWGVSTDVPLPGAIAVFSRGSDPRSGHVAFLLERSRDHVEVLGGNQSDSVSVARYPASRLLGLRWPAGVTVPFHGEENIDFLAALAHVLRHEGGWSNDPHDPGGETNQGITLEVFARHLGEAIDGGSRPRLVAALKSIGSDLVREIYHRRYWTVSKAGLLPAGLSLLHFDCSVNQGPARAARFLQSAVGAEVDGEIGPLTLAAAHRSDPRVAIAAYGDLRRRHYRSLPHFWRFGRGWIARLDDITRRANEAAVPAPMPRVETPRPPHQSRKSGKDDTDMSSAPKWWGQSLTIWGAIITSLSTILPLVGPLVGLDLSASSIIEFGDQVTRMLQVLGGLVGTAMTVYGRLRATSPLTQRSFALRV